MGQMPQAASYIPTSLMHTAEHVAQQFVILQQLMSILADLAERQNSAAQERHDATQSAEKQIDIARQVW